MAASAEDRSAVREGHHALRVAGDVWLSALVYWYVTGLLAALGLSLGLHLLRPAKDGGVNSDDWVATFAWSDGKWYKQIAVEGYHYAPAAKSNVAFYPVYPLLGRAVMALTGLRAEAALLIVSNLSFLAVLALLAFYVRDRYPGGLLDLAEYTVLTAALFPTGCFFRLTYSESTFLFLTVLAMYAMLHRWPLWSVGLIIGLATATRPVGVALLAPFAIHILHRTRHCKPKEPPRPAPEMLLRRADDCPGNSAPSTSHERVEPLASWSASMNAPGRLFGLTCARLALYLPLACWGLLAFTLYQYHTFGEPFATFKVQQYWYVRPSPAWPERIAALATFEPVRSVYDGSDLGPYWRAWQPYPFPWFNLQFANPAFFLAAIALTALGAWLGWLTVDEIALASLLLVIPYVGRAYEMGMCSTGRFVIVVFPVYLVTGQLLVRIPGPLRCVCLLLPGFFLAIYTSLYTSRYDVF